MTDDHAFDQDVLRTYYGTILKGSSDLNNHHRLHTGKPMLVCGNTAAMLQGTRYSAHFNVLGDRSVHYGAFDCGPAATKTTVGGACC